MGFEERAGDRMAEAVAPKERRGVAPDRPCRAQGTVMADRWPFESLGLDDLWPRPGSAVLDAARARRFSGEIEFDTFPRLRVYVEDGDIYHAERLTDPPIGARLVAAGALTAEELGRGAIQMGDSQHLGRLFDRSPTVDRDVVMTALELMNDEATSWVANQMVSGVAVSAYRRHVSGIHRWYGVPSLTAASHETPLPPPSSGAVASPAPAPWSPLTGVELLDGDISIEWSPAPPAAHTPRPPSKPRSVGTLGSVVTGASAPPGDEVAESAPADAWERFGLIWPTGEIDELLGDLADDLSPAAPEMDVPEAVQPGGTATAVHLRPLTVPAQPVESAPPGAVPDEVVLAIQRAIATIAVETAIASEVLEQAILAGRATTIAGESPDPVRPAAATTDSGDHVVDPDRGESTTSPTGGADPTDAVLIEPRLPPRPVPHAPAPAEPPRGVLGRLLGQRHRR